MGRRYIISPTEINRMISHHNNLKKQKERDELIKTSGGQRELAPEYSLVRVEMNEKTRMTKIELCESKKYRTVERYVTRDYVKYPILSEWKTKTKTVKKSIKLTDLELETLNRHSDELIKQFSFDIVAALDDERYYPSWFLERCFRFEFEEIKNELELQRKNKNISLASLRAALGSENSKCDTDIKAFTVNLEALRSKQASLNRKIEKAKSRKESVALNIVTCFVYTYLRSDKHIAKLSAKTDSINVEIDNLIRSIKEKEQIKDSNARKLAECEAEYNAYLEEMNAKEKAALYEMEGKLCSIVPLVEISESVAKEYYIVIEGSSVDCNQDIDSCELEDVKMEDYYSEADALEERISQLEEQRDFSQIEALVYEFCHKYEESTYVSCVHFFLIRVIDSLYKYRDEDPNILFLILGLCDFDIQRADSLSKKMGARQFDMVTPTRMAIIFEKLKRYEDAINICEWALDHNLQDSSITFEHRIEKLKQKIAK